MNHFSSDSVWGREMVLDGKTYLNFGGTSYLGMHAHPEFLQALSRNVLSQGSHFGASPVSNLGLTIYAEAERKLAEFFDAPAALLTSSGYMAAQLLFQYFHTGEYTCYHAPGSHPALGLPGKEESSWKELTDRITGPEGRSVLFLDSINDDDKGWPGFPELRKTDLSKVQVVVDDSHGLGVINDGKGCYSLLGGYELGNLIVCGSLGKAMALPAGIVLGTSAFLEELKRTPIYRASSPPAPAPLKTFCHHSSLYLEQWNRLRVNIELAEELLSPYDLAQQPKYPVFTFKDPHLANHLALHGILVTYFPYQSQNPGRIVISALHMETDLRKLGAIIQQFFENRSRPQ